jgi:hypothetical protein
VGGFVGDVISFLGRPFGIYTHDETFTDIQISNLLTPGEADKNARKYSKRSAMGNADTYFKGYKSFQRDYRKKYSAQFMRRQGYAPSSTAQTRVSTKEKTATYLEGLYGYAEVDVESVADKYLTIPEKGRHAIRTLSGYEWATGNVIDGGTYTLVEYTEDTVDTTVVVHMKRDFTESIVDNLTDNYAYDGTEVTIVGEQYTVGAIVNTINVSDQYETVCTHVGGTLPDEIVYTSVERKDYSVSNPAYGTEASYASYRVLSGEVGTELRYWVELADTVDIYDRVSLDITAIIPMKENNAMVDLESSKLEKMLRKLNLSGEQLKSSIENPDMDSAYLMTGINPQYNDDVTNKTMFKMFDYIESGSGNIVIDISHLNMRYAFTLQKTTVNGSIGDVGTVTRSQSGSGAGVVMTLRVQVDGNEYKQIVVSNFVQTYTISGAGFTGYLDSTGGYTRLCIPLDLLNSLPYKEFVWIYERSLVQWYETAAFGTLLKIVAVVLTIMSFGSAGPLAQVMMTAWGAVGGTIMTVASYYAFVVVGALLTSMVIGAVVSAIAKSIGGEAGAIVGALAGAAMMYYGMGFNTGEVTEFISENWLTLANRTLGVVSQVQQHRMEEFANMAEQYLSEMEGKIQDLKEKSEAMENDVGATFVSAIGAPNKVFNSIEEYCNSVIGTDMNILVDYGMQMDYAMKVRTDVSESLGA